MTNLIYKSERIAAIKNDIAEIETFIENPTEFAKDLAEVWVCANPEYPRVKAALEPIIEILKSKLHKDAKLSLIEEYCLKSVIVTLPDNSQQILAQLFDDESYRELIKKRKAES